MTIHLACGHTFAEDATHPYPLRVGQWISCWAVMHPQPGCQAQRKVIKVTGYWQGGLW